MFRGFCFKKVFVQQRKFAFKVEHDEAHDEFAQYFNRETTPKVLITMSPFAKKVRTLLSLFERIWVQS